MAEDKGKPEKKDQESDVQKTRDMWEKIEKKSEGNRDEMAEDLERKKKIEFKKKVLGDSLKEIGKVKEESEADSKSNMKEKFTRKIREKEEILEAKEEKPEFFKPKVEKAEVLEAEVVKEVPKAVEPEVVEDVLPIDTGIDEEDEEDEFRENFWDILEQAGISKRLLVWLITGFSIIILFILFLLFGGLGWFGGDGETKMVERVVEVDDDVVVGTDQSGIGSIISSYVFGLEYADQGEIKADPISKWGIISGIDAGYLWGDEYNSRRVDLIYYVELVRRMQSIYETDVYALLDRTTDRRGELNLFLDELLSLIEEAETSLVQVEKILTVYEEVYPSVLDKRELYEESFFLSMDTLRGQEAYENLEFFIEYAKDEHELKAYFNAYSTIMDMLTFSQSLLKPMYDDVLVNKEALIKGIRVFDVPGSDIEAIEPLELIVE